MLKQLLSIQFLIFVTLPLFAQQDLPSREIRVFSKDSLEHDYQEHFRSIFNVKPPRINSGVLSIMTAPAIADCQVYQAKLGKKIESFPIETYLNENDSYWDKITNKRTYTTNMDAIENEIINKYQRGRSFSSKTKAIALIKRKDLVVTIFEVERGALITKCLPTLRTDLSSIYGLRSRTPKVTTIDFSFLYKGQLREISHPIFEPQVIKEVSNSIYSPNFSNLGGNLSDDTIFPSNIRNSSYFFSDRMSAITSANESGDLIDMLMVEITPSKNERTIIRSEYMMEFTMRNDPAHPVESAAVLFSDLYKSCVDKQIDEFKKIYDQQTNSIPVEILEGLSENSLVKHLNYLRKNNVNLFNYFSVSIDIIDTRKDNPYEKMFELALPPAEDLLKVKPQLSVGSKDGQTPTRLKISPVLFANGHCEVVAAKDLFLPLMTEFAEAYRIHRDAMGPHWRRK